MFLICIKVIIFSLQYIFVSVVGNEVNTFPCAPTCQACYDIREASAFWQRMRLEEEHQKLLQQTGGAGQAVENWLSTHPSHQVRYSVLDHWIPKMTKLREAQQVSHEGLGQLDLW